MPTLFRLNCSKILETNEVTNVTKLALIPYSPTLCVCETLSNLVYYLSNIQICIQLIILVVILVGILRLKQSSRFYKKSVILNKQDTPGYNKYNPSAVLHSFCNSISSLTSWGKVSLLNQQPKVMVLLKVKQLTSSLPFPPPKNLTHPLDVFVAKK